MRHLREEVDDGIWSIHFCHALLGRVDERDCGIRPAEPGLILVDEHLSVSASHLRADERLLGTVQAARGKANTNRFQRRNKRASICSWKPEDRLVSVTAS